MRDFLARVIVSLLVVLFVVTASYWFGRQDGAIKFVLDWFLAAVLLTALSYTRNR